MSIYAPPISANAATATVATSETTVSTTYADLTTTTDTVTVNIGTSAAALVIITCDSFNSTNGAQCYVSFTGSGANTIAASDARAIIVQGTGNIVRTAGSWSYVATGLSAGSTTFKMKYRVNSGTGNFASRYVSVVPL